ncbi:chorismate-binding protein [uncultured Hymenobacter sp.]|uniref:chorismate-binding protein n=1 Tax=uncultured Hymenobacter sp. TaxID=170016 RepID=UPI0035CBD46A
MPLSSPATAAPLGPWPGPPAPAEERLRALVAWALATGRPLAVWSEPGARHWQLLISRSLEAAYTGLPPALEPAAPAGFAFFPFRDSDHNPALFLPADLLFGSAQPDSVAVAEPALWAEFLAHTATIPTPPAGAKRPGGLPAEGGVGMAVTAAPVPLPVAWPQAPSPLPAAATEAEYAALVAAGVAAIRAGAVQKVVSSRAVQRALPPGFDALTAVARLRRQYPQAFVSLVSAPGVGTWLGATPEVLAEVLFDGRFRTMALAGTQPLTAGLTPQNAIWRQKEIEEQALVARYIVSCFKQLRLREYHETGPRTVAAGQLLHLRTDFAVDLGRVPFPSLGTDMLRLLHPTSAVGGMPKAAALDFIAQHEGYDRAYYSGFLGPVNVAAPGVARLFVNLRCMQLRGTTAILYAGTGLTADSEPEREWRETELKLQTVAAVLQ